MKLMRSFLATNLIFTLVVFSFLTIAIPAVPAQNSTIALQRGYRTGYSDGYMSGYRDAIENAAKSYTRHSEYKTADRAFNSDYGKLTDYKDGYQQGFEKGYDTGFSKQSFDATIPTNLGLRGVVNVPETTEVPSTTSPKTPIENNVATVNPTTTSQPTSNTNPPRTDVDGSSSVSVPMPAATTPASYPQTSSTPVLTTRTNDPVTSLASGDEIILIPADTELIIELIDEIDTKRVREGDAFKAKVTSPYEISGAIIEGPYC